MHVLGLEAELRNYYEGPLLDDAADGGDAELRTIPKFRPPPPPESFSSILGAKLVKFYGNYADPWYEDFQDVTLEQGDLNITFETELLSEDKLPKKLSAFNIIHGGSGYFPMGVIFRASRKNSDKFCCLFEDGKYFYCDAVVAHDCINDDSGYVQDLQELKKWLIEMEEKKNEETTAPHSPMEEGDELGTSTEY